MAITINARGTSFPSFQIGKGGTTLFHATSDPGGINGDFWFDKSTGDLKAKISGTWNKFWHAGNDGAGSTLDADLLDGQHGTYYLDLANATGVLTGTKGGTGLSSYTVGNYLRAATSTTLEQRTPNNVRADIQATTFTASESAPAQPSVGDEWVRLSTGIKYVWYDDTTSSQWVELGSVSNNGYTLPLYIQTDAPVSSESFMWIQTGIGADGSGTTFWINN